MATLQQTPHHANYQICQHIFFLLLAGHQESGKASDQNNTKNMS